MKKNQQQILFVTRNYPPKTGGLENYSYHLIREFEKLHTVFKITLSLSNRHLIWFLPYGFLRALYMIRRHSIDHIHLCDGVLAPVGSLLKLLGGAHVSISFHGLDITFQNPFYQMLIPRCAARLDKIVCVSHATRSQCLDRGIPADKCHVIRNGIDPDEFSSPDEAANLRQSLTVQLGFSVERRKILVTVGRLVPRKGIQWFVEHVVPRLGRDYIYIIAGEGPLKAEIQRSIEKRSLQEKVVMLGRVSNELRNLILNSADIFIMPNIHIPGDMEGFGIAALEAGSTGLPVVASDLQGIRDAVLDGITGHLVAERDVQGFADKILSMNLNRASIRSVVNARFNWSAIAQRYADVLYS